MQPRKWVAGIFLLLCTGLAFATTIIPMSIEKMTAVSTDVLEGRAIDSKSAWNPQRTLIHTYTRFEVRRTLKGTASNIVTVKQMGGQADGYTQRVSGVHQWHPGEEAVLFLRPSEARDGTMVVTGLMQGSFHVTRTPSGEVVVDNGVVGVDAMDARTRTVGVYRGSRMTLQQLEHRVRKAMQE